MVIFWIGGSRISDQSGLVEAVGQRMEQQVQISAIHLLNDRLQLSRFQAGGGEADERVLAVMPSDAMGERLFR